MALAEPPDLRSGVVMNDLTRQRHRPFGPQADTFHELLHRYPEVSEAQTETMISIYGRLSLLEVALLLADEKMAKPLNLFLQEQSVGLHMRRKDRLVLLIAYLGSFAMIVAFIVAIMR